MLTLSFQLQLALAALLLAAPAGAGTLTVPQQFPTIQAAVDAAQAGDTVLVAKGLYPENVSIQNDGLRLLGKPGATVDGRCVASCITASGDDLEISGFTLVNGGALVLGPPENIKAGGLACFGGGAWISRLTVTACQECGIVLEGRGTVEKCKVDGCSLFGIRVRTHPGVGAGISVVRKCSVSRCFEGLSVVGGPFLVEKNDVSRCNFGMEIDPSIVDDGAEAVPTVVRDNVSRGHGDWGLLVSAGPQPVLVQGNELRGNGTGLRVTGHDLAWALHLEISSNVVEDNVLNGIWLSAPACRVADNKIRFNGRFGIVVDGPDFPEHTDPVEGGHEIEANIVQGNAGDGLRVLSHDNLLRDNLIRDNLGDGLQLDGGGVTGNVVQANTIRGNTQDGLDNRALLTTLLDNVCKDNGGADLAGKGDGTGTVADGSAGNLAADGTGLLSEQELELEFSAP